MLPKCKCALNHPAGVLSGAVPSSKALAHCTGKPSPFPGHFDAMWEGDELGGQTSKGTQMCILRECNKFQKRKCSSKNNDELNCKSQIFERVFFVFAFRTLLFHSLNCLLSNHKNQLVENRFTKY